MDAPDPRDLETFERLEAKDGAVVIYTSNFNMPLEVTMTTAEAQKLHAALSTALEG